MNQSRPLHCIVRRALTVIFLAVIGVGLVGGDVALAHNSASGSSPSDGEVVTTPLSVWTVTFVKSVPLASASGQLVDNDGIRRDLPGPRHGANDNVIVFDLPSDIAGRVTARWRLVGTDGHVISGRVLFSVEVPATTTPTSTPVPAVSNSSNPASQSMTPEVETSPTTSVPVVSSALDGDDASAPELVRALVRFSTFAVLTLFGGLLFAEWYIAKGTLFTLRGRQVLHATTIGLFLLPATSLMILVDDLRGESTSFFEGLSAAISLTVGPMIVLRIAVGGLLVMLCRSLLGRRQADNRVLLHLLVLVVVYCITLSYGGHSRSQRLPQIGIPADVVHVLAASVWLGGLAILLAVVIPAVKSDQALTAFLRFGYAAERTVPLIIVTGLVQSLRLHNSIGSFFTSDHGLLLLAKVGVVLAMMYLGNRNRLVLANRRNQIGSRAEIAKATLIRRSVYELLLGAGAIGITSILVSVTPV